MIPFQFHIVSVSSGFSFLALFSSLCNEISFSYYTVKTKVHVSTLVSVHHFICVHEFAGNLQRLAGKEEILPIPEGIQSNDALLPKDIGNSIQTALSNVGTYFVSSDHL